MWLGINNPWQPFTWQQSILNKMFSHKLCKFKFSIMWNLPNGMKHGLFSRLEHIDKVLNSKKLEFCIIYLFIIMVN
jgi:hypothetical protein